MKKEDLDALAGLYEGVYSPADGGEYLSEDYLIENPKYRTPANDFLDAIGRGFKGIPNALTKPRPGLDSALNKPRGVNVPKPAKPAQNSALAGRVSSTNDIQSLRAGQEQARKDQLAKASKTQPTGSNPPANPGGNQPPKPATAKVAPAAAKPAGQTGDKAKDMATWAKANPTLANKPKTPNPLMQKTFGYQKGGAPDQVAKTAAATTTAGSNLTGTGALAPKPTPSTTPIRKPGAVMASFEWGSKATLKDVESLYSSIYEGKKKDQDQDGDNDFADVRIARMIASGMSKAEAIAAVKNKEYNEEFELDEATRMRKELGKEGETATRKELAARSKAYKRSGSVDKTIAAAERGADRPYIKYKRDESDSDRKKREERQSRTLRGLAASRRGSVRDKPRAGMSGYASKVEGGDKDLQSARQKAMSAGTLTPKEKKQLGEVYEIVASYLLENNFATTINDANVIIENMSEVWLDEILEAKKSLPVAKMKRKESKLLDNEEGQLQALRTNVGSKERKERMKELQRFDNINSVRTSVAKRGGKQQHSMPEIGRYKPKDED